MPLLGLTPPPDLAQPKALPIWLDSILHGSTYAGAQEEEGDGISTGTQRGKEEGVARRCGFTSLAQTVTMLVLGKRVNFQRYFTCPASFSDIFRNRSSFSAMKLS
jgi:hypothetical protein